MTLTVTDTDNGLSATASRRVTVDEPLDEEGIGIQPELPKDLRRPAVNLGQISPEAAPIISGVTIENSSNEPLAIDHPVIPTMRLLWSL